LRDYGPITTGRNVDFVCRTVSSDVAPYETILSQAIA